jgi:hypothetical protein
MAHENPHPGARGSQTVWWLIAVLLAFIAGNFVTRSGPGWFPVALAQGQPLAGARGVYAFTGQLDNNRHGLFMLDVDSQTIWCYEIDTVDGVRKLRLIAARSWIYDRYLQDFNVAGYNWKQVQELVALERGQTVSSPAAADPDASQAAVANPEQRRTRRP